VSKRAAPLAAAAMLGVLTVMLAACATEAGGYGGEYDEGYPLGFYEPFGYYGDWGPDYFVGPPAVGGFFRHRPGGGGRPGFHPNPAGHPVPSIPTAPRGGFHGGGRTRVR